MQNSTSGKFPAKSQRVSQGLVCEKKRSAFSNDWQCINILALVFSLINISLKPAQTKPQLRIN